MQNIIEPESRAINHKEGYYTIYSEAECRVGELFGLCHKADACMDACRQCPNYEKIWSCPPLEFNPEKVYGSFGRCRIYMTRIMPLHKETTLKEAEEYIMNERPVIERMLLAEEETVNGRAMAFVGKCLHCPGQICTRAEGGACRHPEKVRPSLEACGFDVTAISRHYFNTEIKWSRDGYAPEYLTLISALFYD